MNCHTVLTLQSGFQKALCKLLSAFPLMVFNTASEPRCTGECPHDAMSRCVHTCAHLFKLRHSSRDHGNGNLAATPKGSCLSFKIIPGSLAVKQTKNKAMPEFYNFLEMLKLLEK